jgi:putative addiction module CopG family antidote
MATALAEARQQRPEMSLTLPPEFERAIRERVASGAYASADDVFAACLQALRAREAAGEDDFSALGMAVQEDMSRISAGEVVDQAVVLDRMRADYGDDDPPRDEFFRRMNAYRIAGRVASGKYGCAGDVIHAALWSLEQTEAADAVDHEMKAAIAEGIASLERGEGIPGEEALARIRAKFGGRAAP